MNLFAKIKKDQLLRAPSAGKHSSTRVDEGGKKELKSSRDKNARHEPLWDGGEKSLLCDPGSELRLGGRENRRANIINGMKKKKEKKKGTYTLSVFFSKTGTL